MAELLSHLTYSGTELLSQSNLQYDVIIESV